MKELEKLLLDLQRAVSDREKALNRHDQKSHRAASQSVDQLIGEIRKRVSNLERNARRGRQ